MAGSTVVRPKLCTACKTCELQCALAHSKAENILELASQDPLPEARISLKQAKKVVVPVLQTLVELANEKQATIIPLTRDIFDSLSRALNRGQQ